MELIMTAMLKISSQPIDWDLSRVGHQSEAAYLCAWSQLCRMKFCAIRRHW